MKIQNRNEVKRIVWTRIDTSRPRISDIVDIQIEFSQHATVPARTNCSQLNCIQYGTTWRGLADQFPKFPNVPASGSSVDIFAIVRRAQLNFFENVM